MYNKTPRTTASRYPTKRLHYDEDTVHSILDEAMFCTVSYAVDGQPFSIPTAFVREGSTLYIHGSVGSHFIRTLAQGLPVCISVMLADDIVVAKSAFNHSFNYRSVVIFSKAELIEDHAAKSNFFKELTEKIVPGSWDYLRPMTDKEVQKTSLVAFDISECSAKVRSGMPIDEEEDQHLPIWSGLIPIPSNRLAPIADELSQDIPLPAHLQQ